MPFDGISCHKHQNGASSRYMLSSLPPCRMMNGGRFDHRSDPPQIPIPTPEKIFYILFIRLPSCFSFLCVPCTDPGRINDVVTTCVVKSLETNSVGRYKTKSTGPHSSQNSPATADQYIRVPKKTENKSKRFGSRAGRQAVTMLKLIFEFSRL
jgi:hypothetical protein